MLNVSYVSRSLGVDYRNPPSYRSRPPSDTESEYSTPPQERKASTVQWAPEVVRGCSTDAPTPFYPTSPSFLSHACNKPGRILLSIAARSKTKFESFVVLWGKIVPKCPCPSIAVLFSPTTVYGINEFVWSASIDWLFLSLVCLCECSTNSSVASFLRNLSSKLLPVRFFPRVSSHACADFGQFREFSGTGN